MKNIVKSTTLLLSSALMLLCSACSTQADSENAADTNALDMDTLEIVQWEADRKMYFSFEELETAADLIVIGQFIEDAQQTVDYEYSATYDKEIVGYFESTNRIAVSKVFKGDAATKTVTIVQDYCILEKENQLLTFSEMTPMQKGDTWLFFLSYDKNRDAYWCMGDATGRYPLPDADTAAVFTAEADTTAIAAIDADQFGVYDARRVNQTIYKDILAAYSLSAT